MIVSQILFSLHSATKECQQSPGNTWGNDPKNELQITHTTELHKLKPDHVCLSHFTTRKGIHSVFLLFACIAVFLTLDVLSCSLVTTTSSSEDTTVNIILSLHFNRCVDTDSPPKGNYLSLSCLRSLLFAVLLQWKNPFRTIKNLPGYLISSLSLTFTVTYQQQDSCYSTTPVNFKWS